MFARELYNTESVLGRWGLPNFLNTKTWAGKVIRIIGEVGVIRVIGGIGEGLGKVYQDRVWDFLYSNRFFIRFSENPPWVVCLVSRDC